MRELTAWGSFYEVVGAAAGALIGLQFVVMTLISTRPTRAEGGPAFATPTIMHFCAVLLLAAAMCAPWPTVTAAAVAWGVIGLSGFGYALVVARRIRTQTAYRPVFEDWLFHAALPLAAYAAMAGSAAAAVFHTREALFSQAGAALVLLFAGIHNAWDAVTYHVYTNRPAQKPEEVSKTV